jgi:hypothetical protein
MASQETIHKVNRAFLGSIEEGRVKTAADAVTDYTRTKIREEGFTRKILPPIQVSDSDLTRQMSTPLPCIVVDKQAESGPAMSVPFATTPREMWLKAPRYMVSFSRILTPEFQIDKDYLRTYHMDVRQQISDQAIRDVGTEEDTKFIGAVKTAMIGINVPVPYNGGVPQWRSIPGGITRDSMKYAKAIMRRGPSKLSAEVALINHITVLEFEAMDRNEIGGDLAQDIFKNGYTETVLFNLKLFVTIKTNLVADDEMFLFADPKFLGKFFILEDLTMHMENKAFILKFFAYQTTGMSFGNTSGLALASFS